MSKFPIFFSSLAAGLLMAAAVAPAAQAANPAACAAYAKSAVLQQNKNLALGCGFAGPRWNNVYLLHFNWCLTAPYSKVKSERHIRHAMLNQCAGAGPGPAPFTKTFVEPMYNGLRLDWCYSWATQCGAFAAKAYCVAHGYPKVKSFGKASHIGTFTKTRVFSTGQVCAGPNCDGFTFIKCKK